MSLAPETEAFIIGRIASGHFRNASEVVRAALHLLEEDEHRREALASRTKKLIAGDVPTSQRG